MYARRKAAEQYREPIEMMWPHHFVVGLRLAGFAIVPIEDNNVPDAKNDKG